MSAFDIETFEHRRVAEEGKVFKVFAAEEGFVADISQGGGESHVGHEGVIDEGVVCDTNEAIGEDDVRFSSLIEVKRNAVVAVDPVIHQGIIGVSGIDG